MARRIPIVSVTQSGPGVPGTFVIGTATDNPTGNWTSVFQGQFYRQEISPFASAPFYGGALPGYQLIAATQFEVVGNASYSGRYTVYTATSALDLSSTFASAQTTIKVNETLGAAGSPGDLTSGYITNISTYYIVHGAGAAAVIVPPGVTVEADSLEFVGRNFSGWGEIFNQNYAELVQNFASATAPTQPVTGMLWFNSVAGELNVWNGSWLPISGGGTASSYRHTQASGAMTWTINHNLAAVSPFVVHASFFIDTGGGVYKPIIPADVSYVNANQLTVTFTTAYTGIALIRS